MLITPHVAVGGAVGLATGNPILGFLAGFCSHFICDSIPHVDAGSDGVNALNVLENKKALMGIYLDFIISLIVIFIFLVRLNFSTLFLWGSFGAILPDVLFNVPYWARGIRKYPVLKQVHAFHQNINFTIRKKNVRWVGYLTQVVMTAASFWFIFTS